MVQGFIPSVLVREVVCAACDGRSVLSEAGSGYPDLVCGGILSPERHREGLGSGGGPHLQLYYCDVHL